jgi:hypothetical protein
MSVYSLYLKGSVRKGQGCFYPENTLEKDKNVCILSVPERKRQERTGLFLSGKYLGKGQECLYTLCTWREA